MSTRSRTSLQFTALSALFLLNLPACSTDSGPGFTGTIGSSSGTSDVSSSTTATSTGGATSTAGSSHSTGTTTSTSTATGTSSSSGTTGATTSTASTQSTGSSGGTSSATVSPSSSTGGTSTNSSSTSGEASSSTSSGGQTSTGSVSPGAVDCTLPDLPEAGDLPDLGMKLPDPFTFYDGTKVTTKAQWECRRQEILAMAAKYLYGPVPGDCDEVSGTVSGGTVSITCKVGTKSENFSASISGSGKSINLNLSSGILPQGKSLSLGSGNDAKIKNLYGINELNPNITNAWMINRVMDVLEANPDSGHDPKTIAVSGCSGCGKGAFLAGVFSRAPIVVIVESGGGGGSSWRMNEWFSHGAGKSEWSCSDRPQGIDVLEDNGICGPWVTSAAASFRAAPATVNNMPFDQHMLLATIAPRYLVHFSNDQFKWCWLGGTAEAMASWAAHSVYKALGVPENHSFEIYSGGHCSTGDSGIAAAMFERALDGNMMADTGKINIQDSRVAVPVSEWQGLFVDWDMDTVLE